MKNCFNITNQHNKRQTHVFVDKNPNLVLVPGIYLYSKPKLDPEAFKIADNLLQGINNVKQVI